MFYGIFFFSCNGIVSKACFHVLQMIPIFGFQKKKDLVPVFIELLNLSTKLCICSSRLCSRDASTFRVLLVNEQPKSAAEDTVVSTLHHNVTGGQNVTDI